MIVKGQFPKKLKDMLTQPARYKVARGGRGSAKSWSFARALLLMGVSKKIRVLCAREVQISIKQSVHKLLKDQIEKLNIGSHYTILESEIRGRNGTEFAFTGLSTLTVETIKSFEGYDICWVEEGQTISKRSWDILIPTIRKDGSEIWVSYNPDLETDETHQRFTIDPPPDCINVEMNWRDNPFFNDVLEKERVYCLKHNPDDYDNIWEGKCRPAVEGAIYYKEIQDAEDKRRVCNVPYDPMLKVHVIMDLGWDDSLAAGLVQVNASECRVIEYLEATHTSLPAFSNELKLRQYNWGQIVLPHDGFSGQLNSGGKSTFDILTALGWNCLHRRDTQGKPRPIIEMGVEEGIRVSRTVFPRIYFDKTKCAAQNAPESKSSDTFQHTELSNRLLECLKRFSRHVIRATETAMAPMKNQYRHGADMFRYLCVVIDKLTNEIDVWQQPIVPGSTSRASGWAR